MKIAVCIGHSRRGDDGAVSVSGVSEWAFNNQVGDLLCAELRGRGHEEEKVALYESSGYEEAMSWLGRRLRQSRPDVAVELHFNSAHAQARGHEWLYWQGSAKGKALADWFDAVFDQDYPTLPSRGVLPRGRSDRGALFLRLTPCPAVICEPFFGSNATDWRMFGRSPEMLAKSYAAALHGYAKEVGR